MFAIIDTDGRQHLVKQNDVIRVNRLAAEANSSLEFKAILVRDEHGTKLSSEGHFKVKASVLDHIRDDKVMIFKKKRRHHHRRKNGHRQDLTVIKIEEITVN